MYGVLGEDASDANTFKTLIRTIRRDQSLSVKTRGFGGCPHLLRKGAAEIRNLARLGCTHFVVAYDSDRTSPQARYREAYSRIVKPSGHTANACIVIPVQEVEAWILADLPAVSQVVKSWCPGQMFHEPERVEDPKELLERLSEAANRKPLYDHVSHNEQIAKYLDPATIYRKCPSFRPFYDFIMTGQCRSAYSGTSS